MVKLVPTLPWNSKAVLAFFRKAENSSLEQRQNSLLMNSFSLTLIFALLAEIIPALDLCLLAKSLNLNLAIFSYETVLHHLALVRSHPILLLRVWKVNWREMISYFKKCYLCWWEIFCGISFPLGMRRDRRQDFALVLYGLDKSGTTNHCC